MPAPGRSAGARNTYRKGESFTSRPLCAQPVNALLIPSEHYFAWSCPVSTQPVVPRLRIDALTNRGVSVPSLCVGDFYETLADVEATPDEVPHLATSVVNWLVDSGVIEPERSDCTYGDAGGYRPGPNYALAVAKPEPAFMHLYTNGVEVISRSHTVFTSLEADAVTCPLCGAVTDLVDERWKPNARWDELSTVISGWSSGLADDHHPCWHCGVHVSLNDWQWAPPWAFGHLGFTFWNWPELSPRFVEALSRRLGHRVVDVFGKM